MTDTSSLIIVGGAFAIIGAIIGYFFYRVSTREDRSVRRILKNPHLLVKELKKHGKIYDIGSDDRKAEIELSVETSPTTGKEIVLIKKRLVPRGHPIQKDKKKEKAPKLKKKSIKNKKKLSLS